MKTNFIFVTVGMIAIMWGVYFVDIIIPIDFNKFGILPGERSGIIGIFLSPFLHANLLHLISNTVPLATLMIITGLFFRDKLIYIIILCALIGGAMVWLFGRHSYHVGASGLIYGLAGFLVAFGIFKKQFVPLVVSIGVITLYGSSFLIGLLPIFPGVSWEGHLFGAVGGIATAYAYAKLK